jgi:hypothetical protein
VFGMPPTVGQFVVREERSGDRHTAGPAEVGREPVACRCPVAALLLIMILAWL